MKLPNKLDFDGKSTFFLIIFQSTKLRFLKPLKTRPKNENVEKKYKRLMRICCILQLKYVYLLDESLLLFMLKNKLDAVYSFRNSLCTILNAKNCV